MRREGEREKRRDKDRERERNREKKRERSREKETERPAMGWLRLVGSLKLWVSFAKETY